jgi:hypothetical protein
MIKILQTLQKYDIVCLIFLGEGAYTSNYLFCGG